MSEISRWLATPTQRRHNRDLDEIIPWHCPNRPPLQGGVMLNTLYQDLAAKQMIKGHQTITAHIANRAAELESYREAFAGDDPTLNRMYDVIMANFLANALRISDQTYGQ
jgi:hypothetical protein